MFTTDQRIQATLMQNVFENVHTMREEEATCMEWTASLCIFSVPALWNSSPTAHHNDAILHSPKQQEISVDKPNTTHKLVIM